jgi:hypothetical protein
LPAIKAGYAQRSTDPPGNRGCAGARDLASSRDQLGLSSTQATHLQVTRGAAAGIQHTVADLTAPPQQRAPLTDVAECRQVRSEDHERRHLPRGGHLLETEAGDQRMDVNDVRPQAGDKRVEIDGRASGWIPEHGRAVPLRRTRYAGLP